MFFLLKNVHPCTFSTMKNANILYMAQTGHRPSTKPNQKNPIKKSKKKNKTITKPEIKPKTQNQD